MKRLVLTLIGCLVSVGVFGQVPVPYQFQAGTPASAAQVNANFKALADNALNRANGGLTGNLVPDAGVTIDGVDISAVIGGNVLHIGKAILFGPAAQLELGLDDTTKLGVGIDASGNANFDLNKTGAGFFFVDPVNVPALVAASLQVGTFSCSGCIGAAQILDGSVTGTDVASSTLQGSHILDGTLGTLDIADGSIVSIDIGDGSLTSVDIQDGGLGGIDIADGSIGPADLGANSVGASQIIDNVVGAAEIADGSVGPADLANTTVGANTYGNNVTVPVFVVDADGRLTSVTNTAIAFPAPPPVSAVPEAAITEGTLLARVADNEVISGQWIISGAWNFVTAPTIASLTISGAITLPDGSSSIPAIRFTNQPTSGIYYNNDAAPNGQSVDFGANFLSNTNRALIRARVDGPTLQVMTANSIVMSISPGQVIVAGELMSDSHNSRNIGGGSNYWSGIFVTTVVTPSDITLKQVAGPIEDALSAVDTVSPFFGAYTDHPEKVFPQFSAQEIQAALDAKYGTQIVVKDAESGILGMDYGRMTPVLWQAVKDLHAKVKALETQLAAHKH